MFQRRGDYIAIGDSSFRFGRTDVPLNDVRDVDVKKNWLGLEQLVVLRNHGADYRLAGYTLSRPITDVATALLAALPTQTPR
jgi:hypothetical protein